MQRFVEPSEGAFQLWLPDGYRAEGGVLRGAHEPRPWYRVESEGGGAELRSGDPTLVPSFFAPSGPMMFPMPGVVLAPVAHPMAFAEHYARGWGARFSANLRVVSTRDAALLRAERPDAAAQGRFDQMLAMGCLAGGVVALDDALGWCFEVDVFVVAVTGVMGTQWSPFVTGRRGRSAAWAHIRASLVAIERGATPNPRWQAMVQQTQQIQHAMQRENIETQGRIANVYAQMGRDAIAAHAARASASHQNMQAMHDASRAAWAAEGARSDDAQRDRVLQIRDEVDLVDPQGGGVFRGAPAGFDRYWSDGHGTVVAGGHEAPGPAFHRVTPWRPGGDT